jgi:N-acetylmuramoyl-L-alanine amidase
MQIKVHRPVAILILLNIIGGIFCSLYAQPTSLPAVSKSAVLKIENKAVKDTSDEGVLIVTADSVETIATTINPLQPPEIPAGKYQRANKLYYKMIDSLVRVISEFPLRDSAGLTYAAEWVGTPNMGLRRPNYVIIHHTATNGLNEVLQEFTAPGGREASSHYVINKDGKVYHMLNDLLRSHHAGDSKWGNSTDLNSSSIGIEIVNNGREAYTKEQITSLLILLERLKIQYKIPVANFIGHGDIAPTRKADPSAKFPWKELSENGFGNWYGDTTNVEIPQNFDYLMGLRIIGYDVSYPASAVAAFKRHFMNDNSGGGMNATVRKMIYLMHKKYL